MHSLTPVLDLLVVHMDGKSQSRTTFLDVWAEEELKKGTLSNGTVIF